MCQCDPSLARRCLDPHSASPHLRPAALDVTTPHSPISVSVICISWSRRRLPLRQAGCGPEANQVPRRAAGGRSCRLSDSFLIDFLPLSPRAALYASLARGLRSRRSVYRDSPENLQPSARLLFAEARALPRALPFYDERHLICLSVASASSSSSSSDATSTSTASSTWISSSPFSPASSPPASSPVSGGAAAAFSATT